MYHEAKKHFEDASCHNTGKTTSKKWTFWSPFSWLFAAAFSMNIPPPSPSSNFFLDVTPTDTFDHLCLCMSFLPFNMVLLHSSPFLFRQTAVELLPLFEALVTKAFNESRKAQRGTERTMSPKRPFHCTS